MATDTLHDPATLQPTLAAARDQHTALLYLLRDWDVNAPPHELHAQFTAIEASARNTEALICNAIEVADASSGVASSPAPDSDQTTITGFETSRPLLIDASAQISEIVREVQRLHPMTDGPSAVVLHALMTRIDHLTDAFVFALDAEWQKGESDIRAIVEARHS